MSVDALKKELSTFSLLFIASLLLIFGHLLLQQYMPNAFAGIFGFLLLMILSGYVLFIRNEVFSFVLIIYVCSHFSYGDNHGGLWNIVSSVMLLLYMFSGKHRAEIKQQNNLISILLVIFIFFNVSGWAYKNPMPLTSLLEGGSAFLGYMLMYYVSSKVRLTEIRIKKFFSLMFFLLIYQVAVALIQNYALLDVGTPLVGGTTIGLEKVTESGRPRGTIGHFELFSEYALLMICLLIPMLSSTLTRSKLRFSYMAISIMIFCCISIMIITTMRGALILSVLVTVFYYFVFPLRVVFAVDKVMQQIKLIVLVATLLPIVSVYIGIKELERDFSHLETKNVSMEGVVTGKSINRGGLADLALRRMEGESWIFGFGSGTINSNQWAWFGFDTSKKKSNLADFHNLYVSLPMIYGWIGSVAFVGIILSTFILMLKTTIKYRKEKSFLMVLSFGFTVLWGAFIVHEYKISILRNANYQMLFWIWLGLSSSLVKTIRESFENSLKANQSFLISSIPRRVYRDKTACENSLLKQL